MNNEHYTLKESLGYLITRASRTIRRHLNQELIRNGYRVTGEQFDVLANLWDTDGQHQQRLAETLYKDKTTMTRLIKSIEDLNLVKRVSNKKDKRQKLVYLTRTGKKIMKELSGLAQRVLIKAQKGINPEDLAVCKNVLRQVHKTLSNA